MFRFDVVMMISYKIDTDNSGNFFHVAGIVVC
jgi:hypothetical protein